MKTTNIKIDRLALEGDGVGREPESGETPGRVAFVPYTLPEELAQCELLQSKKSFARWKPTKILQSSPNRTTPRCPHHFQGKGEKFWCGGCDWQQVTLAEQRKAKETLVSETLEKIGGIPQAPLQSILSAKNGWRYRNKVQVPVGIRNKKIVAGFYAPGTHEILPFDDCLVQPELSVRLLKTILELAEKFHWKPYDETHHKGWLRHILIRTNRVGQALVTLVTNNSAFPGKNPFLQALRQQFPDIVGIHQNVQPGRTNVILGRHWIRLWGDTVLEEDMCGARFSYSVGSFFQVNTGAAELLYSQAIKEIRGDAKTILIDMYCGVGCMTILGAPKVRHSIGVEVVPSAIRDAKLNAKINNFSNVEFIESSSEQFFSSEKYRWIRTEADNMVVLVDPPRGGCDGKLLQQILDVHPKRIVYVSCNPATLARDIKILSTKYKLEAVTPVDLFPQTSHIESVSRLERR